jgi:hypothetical protein
MQHSETLSQKNFFLNHGAFTTQLKFLIHPSLIIFPPETAIISIWVYIVSPRFNACPAHKCISKQCMISFCRATFYITGITLCDLLIHVVLCNNLPPDHITICLFILLMIKTYLSQVWWHTPVIPALGRLRQED